jgi:hypothetical protein
MPQLTDVMVDLETLGTIASAVILSIGAVKFNLETGEISDEGFYTAVSIDSNLDFGRRIQSDTLRWWFKQSAAAQEVLHEPNLPLPEALESFIDWLDSDTLCMWSNGADFDLPMLAHACDQVQLPVPWKFWNNRCFRTYKNLPGAKAIAAPNTGVKHNALSDAYNQAARVCAIHAGLFKKVKA